MAQGHSHKKSRGSSAARTRGLWVTSKRLIQRATQDPMHGSKMMWKNYKLVVPRKTYVRRLTHYHTMPHFDALRYIPVENIVRKGEIACNKQFLLFSQFFLPYMALFFFISNTL